MSKIKPITLYYGLTSLQAGFDHAHAVCEVLGHGQKKTALAQLIETACAETQFGTYPDTTTSNGFGLCQLDSIAIDDIKARTRQHRKILVKSHFGYDIDNVSPKDLNDDPLLSFIFCRLFYLLIPDEIPVSLEARARYWKQFYNTPAGKGTEKHYIESFTDLQRNMGIH